MQTGFDLSQAKRFENGLKPKTEFGALTGRSIMYINKYTIDLRIFGDAVKLNFFIH